MIVKVYIKNREPKYDYPEDMKLILDYLNANGKVLVSGVTIEQLYRVFSDDCYCAGWISVNEDILGEFENWLEKQTI